MASPPPHGPGKTFKMMCRVKDGNIVDFEGDGPEQLELRVSQEDADYFTVGQEYSVDFRLLPPPQGKQKP